MKNQKVYIYYIGIAVVVVAIALFFGLKKQDTTEGTSELNSIETALTTENTKVAPGTVRHSEPNFAFQYPASWVVTSFEDAEGETILLRDKETGGDVQVYITPFDEETVITASRVKSDIPDMQVREALQIEIGKAVSGVYFKTTKTGIGESQEIWFAKDMYLYQISAVKTDQKVLADMIATFSF